MSKPSVQVLETINPFESAQKYIYNACRELGLPDSVYEYLKEPVRVLVVSIPVTMADGRTRTFIGYRSQHTDVIGPTKGGVRFHPSVTLDEVKALSIWMTMKCAVLGLPYGGGKGGVVCDPGELSPKELENLSRGYIRAVSNFIGPEKDIPAPDVNTNQRVMGWMLDEYSKIRGYNTPGLITGKPMILGGSAGRGEATGRGAVIVARELYRQVGLPLKGASVAIQGFGNVGSNAARFFEEEGAVVVALSDVRGGVYNPEGIDVAQALEWTQQHGSVAGLPGTRPVGTREVLELPVDIVVPAALENQITMANVDRIKAKMVVEAANGPSTLEASYSLYQRGVYVIPDVIASAGGVTVSYFEWVQNIMNYYWPEEEVIAKLEQMMVKAFRAAWKMSETRRVPLRRASYMVAVQRLADAMAARGWL